MSLSECTVDILKEIEDTFEFWVDFIERLEYTEEQAQEFAKGYAAQVKKLPQYKQLQAIDEPNEFCARAGFKRAKIDPDEAFKKLQAQK